jgi:hypothetical protein
MSILALLLLGTLTGNEIGVGAFVYPSLSRLPEVAHAASVQILARLYGKVAPVWYVASLVSLVAQTVVTPPAAPSRIAFIVSSALFLAALLFSFVGPVPINNRIAAWDLNALPANWKTECARWNTLHAIRTVMLLLSLLSLAWGVTQ